MKNLIQTTDPVFVTFIEALLRDGEIEPIVLDVHMSVVEGSLNVLPRRICVADSDWDKAREILREAGVGLDGESEIDTSSDTAGE